MRRRLFILVTITLSSACFSQDTDKDPPRWWDAKWRYRQSFVVKDPELADKINTASLTIDTLGQCLSGGKDVRVLDEQFRVAPHHVLSEDKGVVELEIELKAATPKTYFVYYGNPQAEEVLHTWERTLGGLYLEVRELNVNAGLNMYPSNLDEARQLIKASGKSFGKKLWDKIDDSANPFAPQQDFYIGIYTGYLFCPETGEYTFATNSDDASFFLVNGQEVASWPVGHVQSVDWIGEEPGRTSRSISLEKGLYKIEYLHVENQGGQLARAGWKKPSDEFFSVIAPEFFMRRLRTEVTGLQEYKKPLNAYFSFRAERSIEMSDADQVAPQSPAPRRTFTTVAFKDLSLDYVGEIVLWRWSFGDGATSDERNPTHEYTGEGHFRVTLAVKDNMGLSGEVAREVEIEPSEEALVRAKLFLDISPKQNILEYNEPLRLDLKARSSAPGSIQLSLVSEARDAKGLLIERTMAPFDLREDEWRPMSKVYDCVVSSQLALTRSELTLALVHNGAPIARRTAIIALASEAPPQLKVKNGALRIPASARPSPSPSNQATRIREGDYGRTSAPSSSSGPSRQLAVYEPEKVVILRMSSPTRRRLSNGWLALPTFKVTPALDGANRIDDSETTQSSAPVARRLKIVFLDESAGESDGSVGTPDSNEDMRRQRKRTYHDFLREMLTEQYPNASITVERVGVSREASSFPRLARISKISTDVIPRKPDLVIIPCGANDILYHLPIDDYKKFLAVAIEMIVGRTNAEVLLVTPAPLISDIQLSYDYALATKEVAQERGIPVADVYSAFYNMGKKWKELYRDEAAAATKGNPIFYLYPNARGQKKIAAEILEEIIR